MTLSTRCQRNFQNSWVFFGGFFLAVSLLLYVMHSASGVTFGFTSSVALGTVLFLLFGELVLCFVATHFLVAFLVSAFQWLTQTKPLKKERLFVLNTLAYYLMYAPLSRTTFGCFGFLIGVGLQANGVELGVQENQGVVSFVTPFLQGFMVQLLLQSSLITLYYVYLTRTSFFKPKTKG